MMFEIYIYLFSEGDEMKILILAGRSSSFLNLRGDLIKELIALNHTVIAASPDDSERLSILNMGAEFIKTSSKRHGINPFEDIKFCSELFRLIKKENIDIVLSSTIKQVIYGSIAAKMAKVDGCFALITGLGYTFVAEGFKAKIIGYISRILYRTALRNCNIVFFQNPDDKDTFIRLKLVDKEKCVVVNGSGVNLQRFQPVEVYNKNSFLCIARLVIDKGVMEYLEAAKIIKEKYSDVEFHLVGGFDSNPSGLKEEVLLKYTKSGYVKYHGSQKDVRPYLRECMVFVLPSYSEGTPRTVLEAMATGRAIITTDAPGCRETVISGLNGFLIPVKDVDELVNKITWMIENPEQAKVMGNESLKIAREKYDVKKVNKQILTEMELI
jgi:glycosyltransferase involved in cell wall biosynthesis